MQTSSRIQSTFQLDKAHFRLFRTSHQLPLCQMKTKCPPFPLCYGALCEFQYPVREWQL